MAGGLCICATPIGNLKDISLRVLETLRTADIILAEDTRHTRKLLNHFEIKGTLRSLHEHNEYAQIPGILAEMAAGQTFALVSDAGLPAVSDPGARLIQAARTQGYPVTVLPGASAVTTALLLSGLSNGKGFSFIGFLPRTHARRQSCLQLYRELPHPLICFESPHRLNATLEDLQAVLGTREVAVCRELTKLHEEVICFPLPELQAYFAHHPARGELTLVIAAAPEQTEPTEWPEAETVQQAWRELQEQGLDKKAVQQRLQERFCLTRNELYALLVQQTS